MARTIALESVDATFAEPFLAPTDDSAATERATTASLIVATRAFWVASRSQEKVKQGQVRVGDRLTILLCLVDLRVVQLDCF